MTESPVQAEPGIYRGLALRGQDKLPVEIRYASKYSAWILFEDGSPPPEFEGLELQIGEKAVQIGPCRIISVDESGSGLSRFVAYDRIQDFEELFFRKKIKTLESASLDLSLVLGYKISIDPQFKNFVADLTYDLNIYANQMDQVDAECRDEPDHVKAYIQRNVIEKLGPHLTDYLDRSMQDLEKTVQNFNEKEHEHHGFYFRKQLWNFILRSPIMARTNLKPFGYNGDAEMMRMIYQNDYQGNSTFGKIMHKYSVDKMVAQAVRNRRIDIPQMFHEYSPLLEVSSGEVVRLLSVACGPARELTDIFRDATDCQSIHISLLDQDNHALQRARDQVAEIETSLSAGISVNYIRESVRTMLVTRELQQRWGKFHFIYSMGLFDYLTAPVAAAVLKKLYNLLESNGTLIIGNLYVDNPNRYYMEYWHDWKILYRSEDDLMRLVKDVPGAETEIRYDATGIQIFLIIKKRD